MGGGGARSARGPGSLRLQARGQPGDLGTDSDPGASQ